VDIEVTKKPLLLSHDPQLDWLVAVEFGAILDGKADEEYIPIDEDCAFARRDVSGPVIGFVLNEYSAYDPAEHPNLFEGFRFDIPVLGLEQASLNEIVLSARATISGLTTADV